MKLKFKVTHFLLTDKLLFGIETAVKGKAPRIALSYSHCIPVTRLRACGMMHSGPHSELHGFARLLVSSTQLCISDAEPSLQPLQSSDAFRELIYKTLKL